MVRIQAPSPAASVGALVLLLASVAPAPLLAQLRVEPTPQPRWWVGLDLAYSQPRGEFGDRVDHAWGFQLQGRLMPHSTGPLGVRLDLGLMRYGSETSQVCLPAPIGCRVGAEVNTENDIYFAGIGPELSVLDGAIYAFGTMGFSGFSTSSSLSGLDDDEAILDTTNQQDVVFAWRTGGGVRIPISGGDTPVKLDLGLDYHRNGVAEYLVEGDIVDNPDGSITIFPNRTEANVLTWRIGVSFGIGGRAFSPEGVGDR